MTQEEKAVVDKVLYGLVEYEMTSGSEVIAISFEMLQVDLDCEDLTNVTVQTIGHRIADTYFKSRNRGFSNLKK